MDFTLLVIAVFVTLMWIVLIRPQRKRQAQTLAMQEGLRVGDEIVTAGGLYGRVERMDVEDVQVEIAPGTSVRIARRAIVGVTSEEAADEEEEAEPAAPNSSDES